MTPVATAWRRPVVLLLVRSQPARTRTRLFSTTPRRLDVYAFIGLGQMGYQMARNLQSKLASADTLRLYDINKAAVQNLVKEATSQQVGGVVIQGSDSAEDAAREANVVISCLPEPEHVRQLYGTILKAQKPSSKGKDASWTAEPRLFIDCSTIDPSTSREVAASVLATLPNGAGQFIDAPMSGGVVGATAGTLTFMVGTPDDHFSRVEKILLRMGKQALHCGPQGSGLAAKLANNYLLAIENIATGEAMNFGMQWGLDPQVLAKVINVSTGRCWPSEVNNPVPGVVATAPASRDYQGGFGIGLMRKDLRLAMEAAEDKGVKLPLAEVAADVYKSAEAESRCKGRDFSVVYRWLGGKE
ncbi:3-hydroxyisobutyrate dehydrogenase-like protein [Podospora didyma]|uniref:3-hydroxyisobutyrate dehydrogenase n=1 Tax=Podospora didyma TaxID=330526 RepID=A0AAE0NWV6_9PEZI|nr:3-hydroxyisobutyrate dehydrogenase-like protein [Podospora didyma]